MVLTGWIVLLIGLAAAALSAGSAFTDVADLPESESSQAYALLAQAGAGSGTENGTIVWRPDDTAIDDPTVQNQVASMLAAVAAEPGVEAVVSPYGEGAEAGPRPAIVPARQAR